MKNKGFTLVELLSVIVIMGIILLVAIPSVFGISKTIKDNMYCTKVHNLESAAKLYGSDYQDDFDDKGYIKVDVKTIIDNNLYKKETDECTLGDEDKGCVVDPRDDSVMDNNTITIVKTGSRFYAYYDFVNEEDIVLCEGKKETDKFKHYDVALDNQGATYPGTTIIKDVIFGHEMPNIEVPRKEYKVRLIDEYNHIDRTETVKYTFRGYFAAKNGGVKYYDESGKNVHYYNLPDGRPLYAVWTDKNINLPKQAFTGYEFRGWFTSRNGEDFIMESGNYTPTSDITLYARWVPKVSTITLDSQSATVEGTKKIEATYNEPFPNITIPQKEYSVTLNYNGSTTPNTTLKSKNTFDGYWSQRNGKGTQYYDDTGKGIGVSKFTTNSTIYASWINGSITLPDASRSGYKFTGWYTAATGGTKVGNVGSKYNTSKNITLYAQWKEIADGMLVPGYEFNGTLKKLAGSGSSINAIDSKIKYIKRSYSEPPSGAKTVNVENKDSEVPIYAWFDNGTIYIYSPRNRIYLNPDSSHFTSYMEELVSIDFDNFDTSKVTNMYRMFYRNSKLEAFYNMNFNTANVSNMSGMFYQDSSLKKIDVSNFNTSKVVDMEDMFMGMEQLEEIDVSHFDTRNVTSMGGMFYKGHKIKNLDVSHFDTSNVTDMSFMFYNCMSVTELDVSHFDTRKVTNMDGMFSGVRNVKNLDVSHFDTSNVTNMSWMFREAVELKTLDVRNWNTSKVTNMSYMFGGQGYPKDMELEYIYGIENFNTSNVTNMNSMFFHSANIKELNLTKWDVSKVKNFSYMFCSNLHGVTFKTLDLSTWDTSSATNMDSMFAFTPYTSILFGPNWNTSKVTNMDSMFEDTYATSLDLSRFDTSNVTDMSWMFAYSKAKVLDLSSFDTSNVKYMNSMFSYSRCSTIYVSNKWNTSMVSSSSNMFEFAIYLIGGRGTKYDSAHNTVEYARIDGVGGPGYLTRK